MSQDIVRDYYAVFDEDEWNRLTWPEGVIEFAVTEHALKKHLPQEGYILDIGGGPGRYSIWLAEHGYRVFLADLSPNLLEIARKKSAEAGMETVIEGFETCDVCDLSRFENGSFDAVLCLGPFYHLIDPDDRAKAAEELLRVLKPNGVAFVAFMPVYTFLRRTLALKDERAHFRQNGFISRLMHSGVFLNDIPGRFNAGYGARPEEVSPFMEQHGFRTVELLADTGFAAAYANQLSELSKSEPETHARVMQLIVNTSGDPSLLGASIHMLYVGRRRS